MLRLTVTFVRYVLAWINTLAFSILACILAVLIGPSRMWVFTSRRWAVSTLWLVGVRLNVEGLANLKGPALFIANHQSLIDVVFMPALLPRTVRFVAKKELRRIPLWGWAFAAGGAVLIDRKNPRAAISNIREGLKRLPKDWSLVVFPEGTRTQDGSMRPFKKGAFHMAVETGLPLVPIGMDGAREIVPRDGWLVRSGEVRVVVGKPLDTRGWTNESLDQHMAEGRAAVQRCVDRAVARRQADTDTTHPSSSLFSWPWATRG
ncbi:MAG TPA: lysophospholipid acyltransferase family protein, partial [Myxococcota bacterium]|nr:lysophospholipid acyltransferase family protein [Myxococcota bacterium]